MKQTFLLLVFLTILSGCAVLDEDCRPITRALNEKIAPENTAAQIALSPLAVPEGFFTLTVDGALIQPVRSIPDSWDTAYDLSFEGIDFLGFAEILATPMRIITFTVVFFGAEAGHCIVGDW